MAQEYYKNFEFSEFRNFLVGFVDTCLVVRNILITVNSYGLNGIMMCRKFIRKIITKA